MNRSFDATTINNTLLNSCDRWESSQGRDNRDVVYLKVPKRRPSNTFLGSQEPLIPIASKPCISIRDKDGCCHELCDKLSSTNDFDGWASGAWLYIPQFPVPENKHLRCHVRFASLVEEREYAVTLGDNPSCHGPCALTLDWRHTDGKMTAYNDDWDGKGDDECDSSHLSAPGRPARYLSTNDRRERVLEFLQVSRAELEQLELEMAPVDGSSNSHSNKPLKSTRRRAVWQKGHVRRPSYDDT